MSLVPSSNGTTDLSAAGAERAIGAVTQAPAVISTILAQCTDEEFLELDSTISAGLRQINRGIQDVADGLVRTAFALAQMEATQAYTHAGYSSFAEYVKQRHGLSLNAARNYTTALRELGSDGCRELFISAGAQRMFLVAQLKRLAPDWSLLDELLSVGQEDKPLVAALPVSVLEQTVSRLEMEIKHVYEREAALLDKLTMQSGNERNLEQVLADVRKTNRELVSLRDKVETELTRELANERASHQETSGALRDLKKDLAALKKQPSRPAVPTERPSEAEAAQQPPIAAPPAPLPRSPESPPENVKQIVEVISAQCDPSLMADMVRSTVAALRRYQEAAANVSAQDAQPLHEAIADVISTGDVAFVSMVVSACAVALGRIPSTAAIPARHEGALQGALVEFSEAIKALYPTGPRAPHAPAR